MTHLLVIAITCTLIGTVPRVEAQDVAPAGLELLPHGIYYQSSQGWKKLEVVTPSGFSTKHGASSLVGVPPGGVFNYAEPEASNQFEKRHPVFGIKLDAARPDIPGGNARDLLIVRMSQKKDHRELQVIHGGFASIRNGIDSKDIIGTTLTIVANRTYTLVPKNDLKPGEYLLLFSGTNGRFGYDFGIK